MTTIEIEPEAAGACGCSCCADAIERAKADRNPFAGCNCHDYPSDLRCDCPFCTSVQTWGKPPVDRKDSR